MNRRTKIMGKVEENRKKSSLLSSEADKGHRTEGEDEEENMNK